MGKRNISYVPTKKLKVVYSYVNAVEALGRQVSIIRYLGRKNNYVENSVPIWVYNPELEAKMHSDATEMNKKKLVADTLKIMEEKGILIRAENKRFFSENNIATRTRVKKDATAEQKLGSKVLKRNAKSTTNEYFTDKEKAEEVYKSYQELCGYWLAIALWAKGYINLNKEQLDVLERYNVNISDYYSSTKLRYLDVQTIYYLLQDAYYVFYKHTDDTSMYNAIYRYIDMYIDSITDIDNLCSYSKKSTNLFKTFSTSFSTFSFLFISRTKSHPNSNKAENRFVTSDYVLTDTVLQRLFKELQDPKERNYGSFYPELCGTNLYEFMNRMIDADSEADEIMEQVVLKIGKAVSEPFDMLDNELLPDHLAYRKENPFRDYSMQWALEGEDNIKNVANKVISSKGYEDVRSYDNMLKSYMEQHPWVQKLQEEIDNDNYANRNAINGWLLNNRLRVKVKRESFHKKERESILKNENNQPIDKDGNVLAPDQKRLKEKKKPYSTGRLKNTSARLTSPICGTANDIENTDEGYPEYVIKRSKALKMVFGDDYEAVEGRTYFDINASVHRLTMSIAKGRYISKEEVPDVYTLLADKELSRKPIKWGVSERDLFKKYFNTLYYSWVYGAYHTFGSIVNGSTMCTKVRNWVLYTGETYKSEAASKSKQSFLANGIVDVVLEETPYKDSRINADRERMLEVYGIAPLWVEIFIVESAVMWNVKKSLKSQGFESAIVYDCIYTDKPLAKTEEEANAKFEEELAKAFDIVYQQIKVEEE